MYEIEIYQTPGGKAPVQKYIEELAKDNKHKEISQILLSFERLSEYGMSVNNSFPETIRKVKDDVYELRPGPNRVFFFYFVDNKFVLLHAYRKHSQKAPKQEIEKAVNEMKDHIRRNGK